MLSHADLAKDLDATVIKAKRSGYSPITGLQSCVELDDASNATSINSINPRNFNRLDKGFINIKHQLARSERQSIYNYKKDVTM
jgi:hypothetical protein